MRTDRSQVDCPADTLEGLRDHGSAESTTLAGRSRNPRAVVFDLDGTITYADTFLPFVIGYFLHRPRFRLRMLRLPVDLFLYAIGKLSAGALKERFWSAFVGEVPVDSVLSWARTFADRTVREGCRPFMVARLEAHKREGDRIILLSASPSIYVREIAEKLGIHEVVATELEIVGGRFSGKIMGGNCAGEEKLRRLEQYLAGGRRPDDVLAFGNSLSDLPVLRWAQEGWFVKENRCVPMGHIQAKNRYALVVSFLLVGFAGFALSYQIENKVYSLAVFEQNNIFFDADPFLQQNALAHGWGTGGRNYRHPNFANILGTPIRMIAKIATIGSGYDLMETRMLIALLVIPLFRAATTVLLLLMFLYLGLKMRDAILLCLLDLAFLSNLVFGSIPETFLFSSFAIAGSFCLAAEALRNGGHIRKALWIACGVFAVGVTVTNIVPWGCALLMSQWNPGNPWRKSLLPTLKICGAVVLLNVILFASISPLYGEFRKNPEGFFIKKGLDTRFFRAWLVETSKEFPFAISDTVMGPLPPRHPLTLYYRSSTDPEPRYQFVFSYSAVPRDSPNAIVLFLLVAGVLALGTVGWLQSTEKTSVMAVLSLTLLLFNFGLHCFFRSQDLFVYSQHWQVPLLVLCSGIFLWPARYRVGLTVVFAAFLVGVAWNNYQVMRFMITTLESQL